METFIAVDVETTGLDFDVECIIEVAAARFENGKVVAEFQAFLPPTKSLTPIARLLTGLREEELRTAPPALETLRAFLDFAGDLPLVAHNAEFDALFLRRTLEREGLHNLTGPWLDSLLLARAAWPTWDSHRLDSLAARLEILRDAEHRALPDAIRSGQVFLAAREELLSLVSPAGWSSLVQLAEEVPGWNLVFTPEAINGSSHERALPETPSAAATPVPEQTPGTPADSAAALQEISETLHNKRWLTFETSPSEEEYVLALNAAAEAASKGSRVLLCVPDITVWNRLRKHVWPGILPGINSGLSKALTLSALAEPQGYLCRRRLHAVLTDPKHRLPLEERALALPLAAWADKTPSSFIADCRGFSPERARLLWSRVCCDAYDDDAGAQAARLEAASADIVLITYAALFSHLRLEGALLPSCDSVLIAGSHRLPEMARRGFGQEVTFFRLNPILRLLRQSRELDAGLWSELGPLAEAMGFTLEEWSANPEAWFETEKQLQKFFQKAGKQALKRRAPGENRIRYTEPVSLAFGVNPEPLLSALKSQEHFLQRCQDGLTRMETPAADLAGEVRRIHSRLRAFRMDFEKLCEARSFEQGRTSDVSEPSGGGGAQSAFWLEDFSNPHKAALRSAPLSLRTDFGARLQSFFDGGVFLSPAMTLVGDEGRFFLRLLGLPAASEESDKETDPTSETSEGFAPVSAHRASAEAPPVFLLAPFVPMNASTESAGEFAKFLVEALAPFTEKGVFLFFTSPGPLRAVYQALRALLPAEAPLWAQHADGGKDTLIKLFASAKGGWILASEGMDGLRDAEGKAPALAVVTRMPLPSMREPWWEAKGEASRLSGRNPRYELWHPAAALRLKREMVPLQGQEGLKVVWLLDARASSEGLGSYAARSMGCEPQTAADLGALQAATRAVLF